jgi:hypothetical protein
MTFCSLFFGNMTDRAGDRVGMAGGCIRSVKGSVGGSVGCIGRVGRFVNRGSMVEFRVVIIILKEAIVFKYAIIFFLALFLDMTVGLFFFVADFGFVVMQGKIATVKNVGVAVRVVLAFRWKRECCCVIEYFQKLFFLVF